MEPRLRSAASAFFTKVSAATPVRIGILLIGKAIVYIH